jgi:hypothetical protein
MPLGIILKLVFLQSVRNSAMIKHGRRQIRRNTLQLIEPELTFVRRGEEPDPRMVGLVRLLARRAARQCYEEQLKDRCTTRS